MKFMHLGDLHLGRDLSEYSLREDQRFMLAQLLELIDSRGVEAVLIAGDVYDRSQPSEWAVNLLDFFLNELARRGVLVFIISGNHDSDERLNFGSSLFRNSGIYVSALFDGTLPKQTVTDEYGELDVYMLPFVKASYVRHRFPDAKIENYDDAVRTVLGSAELDPARRSVILAHQYVVADGAGPVTAGSEGAEVRNATVGTVESIGFRCFDAFDYAALGHIHSPQAIGRETVRYAGSPLKYSVSESMNEKTVPIVTVKEKGCVEIELVPIRPMRDLRRVRGAFRDVVNPADPGNTNDFIYVVLTDEDTVDDAMSSIRGIYPNTVHIEYDNSRIRQAEQVTLKQAKENRGFPELAKDFYRQIYGNEMSEEELQLLLELAGETGVYYEAD